MTEVKVSERAEHIFRGAFCGKCDPWYQNCQAFVCYLLFSIRMLDSSERKPRMFSRYSHKETGRLLHWHFSLWISFYWKAFMGEELEQNAKYQLLRAINSKSEVSIRSHDISETEIHYDQLITPHMLADNFEGRASVPQRPGTGQTTRPHGTQAHVQGSHGAHQVTEAHRAAMHTRQASSILLWRVR